MRFFLDTAEPGEIRALLPTGLVDGVTTNPSLVAKAGRPFLEAVREIAALVEGPVSAEVAAVDLEGMLREGRLLASLADNVVVKVPLTEAGISACAALSREGTDVNVTLCFSPAQALLAAKAGARFVSPFVGRLDDSGSDGMRLVEDIVSIYGACGLETEVLVASVRHPMHVVEAARLGAGAATLPPAVLRRLFAHPLTDRGLEAFLSDWAKSGQTIE